MAWLEVCEQRELRVKEECMPGLDLVADAKSGGARIA